MKLRSYFHRAKHRGEYRPKPGWKQPKKLTADPGNFLVWNGEVRIANVISDSDSPAMASICPNEGVLTIPALMGPPSPPFITMDDIEQLQAQAKEEQPLYTRVWNNGELVGYAYH
jgi:hypothetical protein